MSSVPTFRLSLPSRVLLAAILLLSFVAGFRQVVYYWTHGPVVSDLRIFRTGVEMVRSGQGQHLYSFDAQEKFQVRLFPEVKRAGLLPFNHLAFELLFYWPLAGLPYRAALIAWAFVNLLLILAIAQLIKPNTEAFCAVTGIPVSAYMLAFYPVLYVLGEGQDSLLFLFLVVLCWRCCEKRLAFLAGLVLALALFKFHLAIAIAFFTFLLPRRWRSLAGFMAGAVGVVGISRLMAGPGFWADYIFMLRNQETTTPWGFVPWFMPNLRGFLQWFLARWLDVGIILPLIFLASVIVALLTTWDLLRSHSQEEALIFSAAVSATLLVSYHLHMQDLTLALLPMLFLLDHSLRQRLSQPASLSLVVASTALYIYRLAAVIAPILLVRGCLLVLPVLLMWFASISAFQAREEHVLAPGPVSKSQALY